MLHQFKKLAKNTVIPYNVIIEDSSMIKDFGNKAAQEIWETDSSKTLPNEFWLRAKALLTIMHSTSTLDDLKIRGQPSNVRLHKLKGDRKHQWSVTIKLPWCITFEFKSGEFSNVRIENYHKG
ncbi:MAG: type II toxin-antitoxin system RelE/ParE family toxin [Oligoflexia bacterium]|nr:type II toxin-antitoxin system RelE/ParE family toxin [Oligoflexia bacterium]